MRRSTSLMPLLIVAGFLLVGAVVVALATRETRDRADETLVYEPGTTVHGASLAEWSARHWQWTLSFPVSSSPGYDASGTSCTAGQSGPVFFIPWNLPPCTIPHDASILIPIAGFECSTMEQEPFSGESEDALRECAVSNVDQYTNISVTIDGEPVRGIQRYRATTDAFSVVLPERNILGTISGVAWAVADGYQVILRPLPPGEHTIIVHAELADGTVLPDKLLRLTVVAPPWDSSPPAAPWGATPAATPVPD